MAEGAPQVNLSMAAIHMGTTVAQGGGDVGGTANRRRVVRELLDRRAPHILFFQIPADSPFLDYIQHDDYACARNGYCGLGIRSESMFFANLIQLQDNNLLPENLSNRTCAAVVRPNHGTQTDWKLMCVSWHGLSQGDPVVQRRAFDDLKNAALDAANTHGCDAVVIAGNFYIDTMDPVFHSVGPTAHTNNFLYRAIQNRVVNDPTWELENYYIENVINRRPILSQFQFAPQQQHAQ